MVWWRAPRPLALLVLIVELLTCDASLWKLRGPSIPVVNTVAIKTGSQDVLTKSETVKSNASHSAAAKMNRTNSTVFTLTDYSSEAGKVFASYRAHASPDLAITRIEAKDYQSHASAPASNHSSQQVVFWPENTAGGPNLPRGSCNLFLKAHVSSMSDWRKYNLRLAELAVCGAFGLNNPCGSDKWCELTIWAPLPSNNAAEPHLAAGMALVAYSELKAAHGGTCNLDHKAIISSGLIKTDSGIKLKAIPSWLMTQTLDTPQTSIVQYHFEKAVIAQASESVYEATDFYQHLPASAHSLYWHSTPPTVEKCETLACAVGQLSSSCA